MTGSRPRTQDHTERRGMSAEGTIAHEAASSLANRERFGRRHFAPIPERASEADRRYLRSSTTSTALRFQTNCATNAPPESTTANYRGQPRQSNHDARNGATNGDKVPPTRPPPAWQTGRENPAPTNEQRAPVRRPVGVARQRPAEKTTCSRQNSCNLIRFRPA